MMTFLNYILLTASAEGGGEGNMTSSLLMMGAIVVVFYFFMIRPQMKQRKELQKFRNEMQKGDKVMTMGGVHGKIADIQEADSFVLLEIDTNVKIKVEKSALVKTGAPVPGQQR